MIESAMIHEVQTSKKMIAFTFDDGPNPVYTRQILEIFQQVSGKATFFMIGSQMEANPEVVHEVAAQGHEIGNHTYTHPFLSKITQAECENELNQTEKRLVDMIGIKPKTFRPPYFDYNDTVVSLAEEMGYSIIGAQNMEARDWEQPGAEHIIEHSLKQFKNGSILLFHDGFGDRSQTVEAVKVLAREAFKQGYKLVTVSELLEQNGSQDSKN